MDLTPFLNRIDDIYKNTDAAGIKSQINDLDEELRSLTRTIPVHPTELQWIKVKLGFIDEFSFPVLKQGRTSTLELFCAPDLVLFLSYYANRMSKNIFIDIGANIGLHTLIARRCGLKTFSFEPDHDTYSIGKLFLEKNSCGMEFVDSTSISKNHNFSFESSYIEAAATEGFGEQTFVRFLDNPTGNHVKGFKKNIYGNVEEKIVKTIDINSFINKSFTAKIDAEGADAIILNRLISNPSFYNYSNAIHLCDWRDETRIDMYESIKNINAEVKDGISGNRIDSLIDTPANKSYDFISILS